MNSAASKKQQFETLFQMMAAFPDEQAAVDHFTAIRWREGAYCPLCGSTDTEELSEFGATACKALRRCRSCREPFEHVKEI